MTATKASQLTATFDAAVPADTTIEVTKGTSVIDGKSTIDGSTVVFDATAKFAVGTYTLTATYGDITRSEVVEVKEEYVAQIVLKCTEALTGNNNTEAYIYYDVLNQYNESMRSSTTINWTTSVGNDTKKVDKTKGKITITKSEQFTYGSLIYVTGVHVKSGVTFSDSVPVGMAQAVDTIKFAGFVDDNDKTTILPNLPSDFAKDTYVLVYQTFDQNGNPLDVKGSEVKDSDLTFICDNVLLVDSDLPDAGIYTIDGEEYSAVRINPGAYVDKGGEVNITAIANQTGQKTVMNFLIGANKLLKSMVLNVPQDIVADGDSDVKIPYEAKDTEGNAVTNYETIVRSTNALTLSASEGTLTIKEENDGTAGVYWTDGYYKINDVEYNRALLFDQSFANDGTERSISLSTIVVGGESNNMILPVSDARRPVTIKSVSLDETIVSGNDTTLDVNSDKFTYLDQYGAELSGKKNVPETSATDSPWKKIVEKYFSLTIKDYVYGLKVEATSGGAMGLESKVYRGDDLSISYTPYATDKSGIPDTLKYSIVSAKSADAAATDNMDKWDEVDKVQKISHKVIPISAVTAFEIADFPKQQLVTDYSSADNGAKLLEEDTTLSGAATGALTFVSTLKDAFNLTNYGKNTALTVTGKYGNTTVSIPARYYKTQDSSDVLLNDEKTEISGVSSGAILWKELYNVNDARATRIDAKKTLALVIDKKGDGSYTDNEYATKSIIMSDAESKITEARFIQSYWFTDAGTVTPYLLSVGKISFGVSNWSGDLAVTLWDQYGNPIPNWDIDDDHKAPKVVFTVSNINEATTTLTHKANSFVVNANGSADMTISGAEIGDTFTLTANVVGTDVSASINVTVGADKSAYITNNSTNADKNLRQELGYDR